MSSTLLESLKGKTFKEGTYTFLKQFIGELLNVGNCTTIFDEQGKGLITSPVTYWEINEEVTSGVIITHNSAYHVVFK